MPSEEWFSDYSLIFLILNSFWLDISCRVFVFQLPFDVIKDGNNTDFSILDVETYKGYRVEISCPYAWR